MRGVPLAGRFVAVLATAALVGAAVGACGGSGSGVPARSTATTSGAKARFTGSIQPGTVTIGQIAAPVQTATAAASISVCSLKSSPAIAGNPPPGTCVIGPVTEVHYQCPIAVAQNTQVDPATNSACHRLAAVKLPASWQPTLRWLAAIRTCLKRAGVVAVGGAVPPAFQRYSDTPIGTLMMAGPTRPTSFAFYASDARASQAYARVRDNVAKEGGTMIRHGQLLIIWGSLPTSDVHASEERCGLHS